MYFQFHFFGYCTHTFAEYAFESKLNRTSSLFWRAGQTCDHCICLTGCVHGYCNNPFECICEDGWTGIFCDKRKIYYVQRLRFQIKGHTSVHCVYIVQNAYFRQIIVELEWYMFLEPEWTLLSHGLCQINQFRSFPSKKLFIVMKSLAKSLIVYDPLRGFFWNFM